MNEDRRQHKCNTPNCNGIVYLEDYKIMCTECDMIIDAKRKDDNHLMTFRELQREYNGN